MDTQAVTLIAGLFAFYTVLTLATVFLLKWAMNGRTLFERIMARLVLAGMILAIVVGLLI